MALKQKATGYMGGSNTTHTLKSKTSTNDGHAVILPKAEAVDAGFLNRDTEYSNTKIFERYSKGSNPQSGKIDGMHSWQPGVNLDDPGFDADGGCFYKNGTPYGEAAMFNQLPPGPDINDQAYAVINEMPLKTYMGGVQYDGDSAFPVRDIPE